TAGPGDGSAGRLGALLVQGRTPAAARRPAAAAPRYPPATPAGAAAGGAGAAAEGAGAAAEGTAAGPARRIWDRAALVNALPRRNSACAPPALAILPGLLRRIVRGRRPRPAACGTPCAAP